MSEPTQDRYRRAKLKPSCLHGRPRSRGYCSANDNVAAKEICAAMVMRTRLRLRIRIAGAAKRFAEHIDGITPGPEVSIGDRERQVA